MKAVRLLNAYNLGTTDNMLKYLRSKRWARFAAYEIAFFCQMVSELIGDFPDYWELYRANVKLIKLRDREEFTVDNPVN